MKLKLYRFEKDEPARIETINRGEIYLSAPQNFNDLKDCWLRGINSPDLDSVYYDKVKKCIDLIYPRQEPQYFPLHNTVEKLIEIFEQYLEGQSSDSSLVKDAAVAQIRSYIRHTTGVCCFFASEPEHPLMWAHYADSHKGFCVEYELDIDEQGNLPTGFHRVVYASQLPYPSILELLLTPEECINRIVTTKAMEWSYEEEVRYIDFNKFPATDNFRAQGSGKCVELPSSLRVTGIITGQNCPRNQLDFKFNDPSVKVELYKKFMVNFNKSSV